MKTSVIMIRDISGSIVRQNSLTEMFSANDLVVVGNEHRKRAMKPPKLLEQYFQINPTSELISELCLVESLEIKDIKSVTRGRNGSTWVHPIIFVDLAMWLSPTIKLKVLKWVVDGLMIVRNDSGDSFKDAMTALTDNFPQSFRQPIMYKKVANAVAATCGVGIRKDRWQLANEEQLSLRDEIHKNLVFMSDVGKSLNEVIAISCRKALQSLANQVKVV